MVILAVRSNIEQGTTNSHFLEKRFELQCDYFENKNANDDVILFKIMDIYNSACQLNVDNLDTYVGNLELKRNMSSSVSINFQAEKLVMSVPLWQKVSFCLHF